MYNIIYIYHYISIYIYLYNMISHIQRSPGAKQRRGGLAPLSAPEQILRSLAREQRHLAYLERWIWAIGGDRLGKIP